MGRLESLDREYAEAEEVVIPVLYGSGVNSKLIEALSFGKACVTTGAGIKGLPEAAEAVICAGSSDQFAEAVIRLFKDEKLRKHYEDAGRKFVVNNLSREHCYRPLVDNISNALACGL
jgi:glycosyltransferase involved in cell wall biosynthesis